MVPTSETLNEHPSQSDAASAGQVFWPFITDRLFLLWFEYPDTFVFFVSYDPGALWLAMGRQTMWSLWR